MAEELGAAVVPCTWICDLSRERSSQLQFWLSTPDLTARLVQLSTFLSRVHGANVDAKLCQADRTDRVQQR